MMIIRTICCATCTCVCVGASIDMPNTVEISNTHATELPFLHLRRVDFGRVVIKNNPELCYVHEVRWVDAGILTDRQVFEVHHNRNASVCASERKLCDSRVCRFGCWGPGNSRCVSCVNMTYTVGVVDTTRPGRADDVPLAPFETRFCLPTCERFGATREQLEYLDSIPLRGAYRPALYEKSSGVCAACHEECAEGCTGPV